LLARGDGNEVGYRPPPNRHAQPFACLGFAQDGAEVVAQLALWNLAHLLQA
jgi:hypothetical protein